MSLNKIGIRRENKNTWERRVPLVPEAVAQLHRESSLAFAVQPYPRRTYSDLEYIEAGAEVMEDLSACDVVMGVKEIPTDLLERNKAYVFFSHVIKGQSQNMPMLKRLLDLDATLIDYELISDGQDRRLVFFGRHAGFAGMINTLSALGARLEHEGSDSPFSRIGSAYTYASLNEAQAAVSAAGKEIEAAGLPEGRPLVFGVSGYGNVSQGAQAILDLLPVREISPAELLAGGWERPYDRIVKVVFREEHLVARRDGGRFELQTYYDQPQLFHSTFEAYLPQLAVLVNAIYWDERYPRLVTRRALRDGWSSGVLPGLKVIGDISIDIEGSIECSYKATASDNPCYVYEPLSGNYRDGVVGDGPVIMAVDNLPCELHRESSQDFSRALVPFMPALAAVDWRQPLAELDLPAPIRKAVIVHRGRLVAPWDSLNRFLPAG